MKKKYGFLIHFLIKMGLLVAAGYLVWTYALCFHRISGNNMFPAGKDGIWSTDTSLPRKCFTRLTGTTNPA